MWLSLFAFACTLFTFLQIFKRRCKGKPALPPQVDRPAFPMLQPGGETPIFHGLRVVELATVVAGPTTGNLFASLGAEVIKVEEMGGDKFRNQFLAYERTGGRQVATMFEGVNFNKSSIVMDLKDRKEHKKFLQLLAGADVFITNIRLDSLARLGLDYESVHEMVCKRAPADYTHTQMYTRTYAHTHIAHSCINAHIQPLSCPGSYTRT
jgi:hypothetical protein